jgi:rod shape-determining protein MreD
MRHLKIALVLALAIILQSTLRVVWPPFVYVDLPLVVVVYFALQRDAMQALMVGVAAGLASDALGAGGLLGAGGFSKTLTAYLVVSLATRVMIDNPLARIPVLAGAALFDDVVYVLLHRILGQTMNYRFVDRAPLKLIATTVAGTIILYLLDSFFSERARQRRQLAFRRRIARRSPVRLGRKR